MFELPAGLYVVGDRAKPTPPVTARPSFRNRWDERQWEAAQAASQVESEALPKGMHILETKPSERPAEMPIFMNHENFHPGLAQAVKDGRVILCRNADERDRLGAEWHAGIPIDSEAIAMSRRLEALHGVERDTLPTGLHVVG
jgi:hypothetical protein